MSGEESESEEEEPDAGPASDSDVDDKVWPLTLSQRMAGEWHTLMGTEGGRGGVRGVWFLSQNQNCPPPPPPPLLPTTTTEAMMLS